MICANKYVALAAIAAGFVVASASVQAGVTTLTFEIVNNTSAPLTLNRASWDTGLATPGFFDVNALSEHSFEANYQTNFDYPRKTPAILREVIAYADGKRECTFTTVLKVTQSFGVFSPSLISTRTASATSTGKDDVECSARVTDKTETAPLSYSVRFTMG